MTNPPPVNKSQIDQLYAAGILTEEAYHADLERWRAGQRAAGDRGVAADAITESQLATGDNSRNIRTDSYIEHQTVNPPPPDPAAAAETRYLEMLCLRHNIVPLAPLGEDEEMGEEVKLEQVYIELDTTTQVATNDDQQTEQSALAGAALRPEGKSRPLTVLEATVGWKKLALLGDPGSGKSTFVRQLIVRLAHARLGRGELPDGWRAAPLPLFLVLNQLSPAWPRWNWRGDPPQNSTGCWSIRCVTVGWPNCTSVRPQTLGQRWKICSTPAMCC